MLKADRYIKETLQELKDYSTKDSNPRPKYADGTPAHTHFLTQKMFSYNIAAGELPITTLRKTAIKGSFHDIESIYIKQTNILEEMHPSIKSWWIDFTKEINEFEDAKKAFDKILYRSGVNLWEAGLIDKNAYKKTPYRSLGKTYGDTIKRYDLMNKLLKGLEENPFGRRHSINMSQEQQKIDDPSALQPCAFLSMWSVRETNLMTWFDKDKGSWHYEGNLDGSPYRIIDLTLIQRSMDYLVTMSINPIQYVMFGMMVCNHLSFKTGIKHSLGNFSHFVQNLHVYDRHFWALEEMLEREPSGNTPTLKLNCEPKDFYSHTWEDFSWSGLEDIKPLSKKLEIAV